MNRLFIVFPLLLVSLVLKAQKDTLHYSDTLRKVDVSRPGFVEGASTTPVQILNADDISTLNSLSVADAIKFFSGVQVKDYGGIGGLKTIDVRSLSSNHTAIFYNGVAINNAQNGQIDLGKFSVENIGSITLYNGQPSNLLLPAKAFSSASTLLLESQVPVFEIGKDKNIQLKFRTGDFGLVNPSLLWQQKISERTNVSFSSEWVKAHGRYDFNYRKGSADTLVERDNSDIEALRIEASVRGLLNDSSEWSLDLYHYSSERGLPGAAVDNNFYSKDRQWDQDFFIQAKWKKKFNDFYSVLFNSKFNYSDLRYLDPEFYNTQGFLENNYTQKETYFSMANLFVLSKALKSSLSIDYLYNTLDADLKDFVFPTRNTLLINAALDWEKNGLHLQANGLTTVLDEKVEVSDHTIQRKVFSPSVSVSWKPFPTQGIYFRSFYKSIFRTPTFNDSYYTLLGSTNLSPEFVTQYDIGFTWQKALSGRIEQFEIKADAYHNRIKDKITAIPVANLFRWSMINLGRVEVNGVDLGISGIARLSAEAHLNFGLNYTHQKALDKTPNTANYNQNIPYSPSHSGSLFLAGSYKKYGLNYNTLFTGERYSLRPNISENLMDHWLVHNISASYQTRVLNLDYKILAELNNLTNKNYTVINGYPMPGRNYRLSIQITY